MKIYGHLWKGLNIAEPLWISVNSTEIVWELLWTSVKITGHLEKSLNITENFWKLLFQSETLWKPLLTLFIADCSSTYVMSTSYELHLRKTQKKNKIN